MAGFEGLEEGGTSLSLVIKFGQETRLRDVRINLPYIFVKVKPTCITSLKEYLAFSNP